MIFKAKKLILQDAFGDFNDSLFDGLVSVQPFCFGDSEFMYDEYR